MSTDSYISGEISIDPPLNWVEIQKLPELLVSGPRKTEPDVKLRINEVQVDTDEGELTKKTASAIVPAWVGSYRAYYVEEHLQQIVDLYPGHTFTGYLEGRGEDPGYLELWRVAVVEGKAITFKPELVWPEEVQDRPDLPF
ncbi:DUF6205 family protein [Streptomyces sp. NPDC000927]|uniref:DUF6205 family protein n=1 Tax=Streptomyces sp. NPDC000927 TaxID=3154371 RepID=UPI00332FD844